MANRGVEATDDDVREGPNPALSCRLSLTRGVSGRSGPI